MMRDFKFRTALALAAVGLAALLPVSPANAAFGIAPGSLHVSLSNSQAGAHPDLTTAFSFNQSAPNVLEGRLRTAEFDLPPGLVGNPSAAPRCPMADLINEPPHCPPDSAVGVAETTLAPLGGAFSVETTALIYNTVPYPNEPAAFAFVAVYPVRLDTSIRSGSDYGVHVTARNLTEAEEILSSSVTFWGVPEEHNGPGPEVDNHGSSFGGKGSSPAIPFLTNPSVCRTPLSTAVTVQSWPEISDAGVPIPAASDSGLAPMPSIDGCDRLPFAPSINVRPESTAATSPTGYEVDVHVPQSQDPQSVATADLKDAVVTLPQGTVVSPSAADGLQACSEAQIGLHTPGPASCPEASKLGSVEVETPLLPKPLEGSVFLAKQTENPFGSLLGMYIVAEGSGVVVKLAGEVHTDATTGQITTRFLENPQLPFSDLRLKLKGGPRAPLANPSSCGPATTTAALTPWSGLPAATATSTFNVSADGAGAACASPRPFAPSFNAGTVLPTAGAFSPFTMTLARDDSQQGLGALQVHMPSGLLGTIAHVAQCPEPQASNGTCGPESLIGHTTVGVGPGSEPFYDSGNVFLTGPYHGAPFGLSIVVHAAAGPIDLGNVIVRAAINIDPNTSALTITSDPLPQILDGIPLQIKVVNVTVDRSGFIFNPTNCAAKTIADTISGTEGATVTVASPFAATGCSRLAFKPKFTASTSAKSSHALGASLDVKVAYPAGAQANIAKVAVTLPKQLPSRLTTIQQACLAAVFNANPAACPAGSLVGSARAITPVLPVALTGPAYLVSHGGAAFPDLVVLLQGEGVRVDLRGAINISSAGVTSSTFSSVPDVPIGSFELSLPEGPHSALTSTVNLCSKALAMPTTITGQNGAVIKQSTKITASGCPKVKKPKGKAKKKTSAKPKGGHK